MDIYAENILDHYKHPRNSGTLDEPTVCHREQNLSCGDDLTIDLTIKNGVISDMKWRGEGCAISQAATSLLSEELVGMTVTDAMSQKPEHIYALLGVPIGPRRLKCALLCVHTLRNALRTARKEPVQSWRETLDVGEDQ